MTEWIYPIILIGAGLVVVSVFTSLIAFRFGAPLILFFLGLGLLVGEDGLGIEFENAETAYFVGSLALAVILFDSGFGTQLRSFRQAATPSFVLATVGVLLTTALAGVAAHYLLGLPWLVSFLVGAIVGSTDAAAVFFLLRAGGVAIRERVRSTLEIESGSNDPMAIFLTVICLELIASGASGVETVAGHFIAGFALQMGLGVALGLAGGYLIVQLVNRVELEGAVYPIVVLGAALCLFAFTGWIGGSGFLAVYVAGLYAGDRRMRGVVSRRRFQEGMTWLAQIGMFLVLGLFATPSEFPSVALPAIGIALFLTFIARPLAVWLCLIPFGYQRRETAFISWVGLRGAVSILLAILPIIDRLESAQLIFNTVFIIVLTSFLVQGWTIRPMARWLGLIVPPRIGPVQRIELELPGTAHHELVAYRVVAESPVLLGQRLPRWARPSLVVRNEQSMRYQDAGRLQAGDYVYMFIAPHYTRLLDKLFASPAKLGAEDSDFFGAFKIDPKRSLGALAEAYGPALARNLPMDQSIADFMRERVGGPAEIGDRVECGLVELIVREADAEGNVIEAGLSVNPDMSPRIPLFLSGRRILDMIKAKLRGKRGG